MTTEDTLTIALQHYQRNEFEQAESLYRQIIEQPAYPVEVLHLLAKLIHQTGKASDLVVAYNMLGQELLVQGKLDAALICCQQALQIKPDDVVAYHNLGNVLHCQNQLEAALKCYQQVLQLCPDCVVAYRNIGHLFVTQHQYDVALTYYQQVLRLQPNDIGAYNNIANLFCEQNSLDTALEYYQTALRLQPNAAEIHLNYALLLLKLGRFQEGWAEHEWRIPAGVIKFQSPYPRWDGTPLAGRRLLVHWEQGFGDTIQFLRYLPLIQGGTIIFACQSSLATLCQGITGIETLIVEQPEAEYQVSNEVFDVWIELMSLPRIFATTLDNIPAAIPYISPEVQKITNWRHRFNPQQLNLGIVWAGSPTNKTDRSRSCTLTHFAPLTHLSNVTFVSLQKGEAAAQPVPPGLVLTSLSEELTDFSDTAAVIACLDLVISVDTAVAHLAGALGKPVWVLLPFASEWRWLTDREDSPWYPTMRLFQQPRPGDWDSVFAQVANELARHRDMLQALRWSNPETSPSSPQALAQTYNDAGNLLRTQHQLETAMECYQRALRIHPTVETYNNLGGLYFAHQRLEEAKDCCQQAIRLQPDAAEAYYNLGIVLQAQNQLEAAFDSYQQAVQLKFDYVAAYQGMVTILEVQLKQETTLADSELNSSRQLELAEVYYQLGVIYQQQKQLEIASEYYQKALLLAPNYADARNNLGSIWFEQRQLEAAFHCYQQLLEMNPNSASIYNNLGSVLYTQNQVTAALEYYHQALRLQPDYAEVYVNLSLVSADDKQLEVALEYCDRAIRLQPELANAHFNRAIILLKLGRFQEGWQEYEWRRPAGVTDFQSPHPQWDGTPLAGRRLLVLWEQGFGDMIQFVRYLPFLKGGTVILLCRPALATLFQGVAGIDEIVVADRSTIIETIFDVWIHLMSLPRLFATTLDNIPATIPYLQPDFQKIVTWRQRFSPQQLNIGIVWAGSPTYKGDYHRSCTVAHFAPLANLPNVAFFSLQKGATVSQPVPAGLLLTSLSEELNDFSDTAAVIACLDLIIAVDTAVAHLAGALGKPVWVLLPFASDWRWLTDRDDSPWYPTMRLFRQPQRGDWDSVFAQVVEELAQQREMLQAVRWSDPASFPTSPAELAQTYHEAGNLFRTQAQLETTTECYQRALRIHPTAKTYNHLGELFFTQNRLEEAKVCYQQALRLQPDSVEAYGNLGNVLQRQNQLEAAIDSYQHLLQLQPDCAAAYGNLGNVYYTQNQLETALECYQQVLRLQPENILAYQNLGKVLQTQNKPDAALACYQQLLCLQPDSATVYNTMGNIFYEQKQLDAACACYQKALLLQPENATVCHNLAVICVAQNHFPAALEYYQTALHLQPNEANTHFCYAMLLLKLGRFHEGWLEYEWRLVIAKAKHEFPALQPPQWNGSALAGRRLLVHWEQGFGDMLQWVRYLPLLTGGTVIFACHPALESLCRTVVGIDTLIVNPPPFSPQEPELDYDVWIALASLPRIFATTLDNVPTTIPYLVPAIQKVESWQRRFNPQQLNVGIVWAGNPAHADDYNRSCPLVQFTILANLPNVALFSVQKGEATSQPVPPGLTLISLSEELADFSDTAAVIACLDLVIAVDTAVAHLAGALGKPIWLLLPFASDWRWLTDREDSPWYPTMRLFRQSRPGDWESVFTQVVQELARQREVLQAVRWETSQLTFPTSPQELAKIYQAAGEGFRRRNNLTAAVECYQQALRIHPSVESYNKLGGLYYAQNQLEAAKGCCQQVLRLQPQQADAHYNLGVILQKQEQFETAFDCYQQAVHLRPEHVEAINNQGVILALQNRLTLALQYFQQALRIQPTFADAHLYAGLVLLKTGSFSEGWQEYEWRLMEYRRRNELSFRQPQWDGSPLAGRRLLVHWEQGFGDMLQFIRYLPLITGGTVILACRSPLATLCQSAAGIDELVRVEALNELPQTVFEVWLPILSLSRIFATTLETIPAAIPYLQPEAVKMATWRARFDPQKLNIGIAWAGDPSHPNDRNRSCALTHFALLASLPNVTLFSLQKGKAASQPVPAGLALTSLSEELADFSDTAAVIAGLDLVIAVDTAVVHLAGALGKPVWVLLPFVAEWRWLTDREDSPWYPTMRLFRQPRRGDWGSVFAQVVQELARLRELLQAVRWSKTAAPASPAALAQTYTDAGNVFRTQNQAEMAIACYQQALRIYPTVETYNNLGGLRFAQDQLEEAKDCCQRALRLQPESAEAYYNLGFVLQQQNQLDAAVDSYQQAVRLRPDYVEAIDKLGAIFAHQHQPEAALACYQQILRINPHHTTVYNSMGGILYYHNQLAAALQCYQQALQLAPHLTEAYIGYACTLLKMGNFNDGWRELVIAKEKNEPLTLKQPQWDGTPLAGRRLLVHWEQGFGDMIQFIRYLPLLTGGTVILACQVELASLFRTIKGVDILITTRFPPEEPLEVAYDVWTTLLSLPAIFATTVDQIPIAIPYIFPESSKVANWRYYFDPKQLNIGIVWAGSPIHTNDRNRSCVLTHFASLAKVSNLALFGLQKGEAASQPVPAGLPFTLLTEELADFSDTAAVIACLDLVIVVDTAVAHLAGALGKPVWVLLSFASEWRWLTDREDSPWYPTMRLFRQPRPGDWESVFAEVVKELWRWRELLQAVRWSPYASPSSPPELAQIYHEAGQVFRTQHQLEMAIACYQQALRIHPLVETYNNLDSLLASVKASGPAFPPLINHEG